MCSSRACSSNSDRQTDRQNHSTQDSDSDLHNQKCFGCQFGLPEKLCCPPRSEACISSNVVIFPTREQNLGSSIFPYLWKDTKKQIWSSVVAINPVGFASRVVSIPLLRKCQESRLWFLWSIYTCQESSKRPLHRGEGMAAWIKGKTTLICKIVLIPLPGVFLQRKQGAASHAYIYILTMRWCDARL